MWTVMTALILAQAAPAADAETLGLALARSGTLATMLPLIEAKETEEMIADHAELSDAEKAALRATAERVGRAGADRILTALGHAYAERLSIADLHTDRLQRDAGGRALPGRGPGGGGGGHGGDRRRGFQGRDAGRLLRGNRQGLPRRGLSAVAAVDRAAPRRLCRAPAIPEDSR